MASKHQKIVHKPNFAPIQNQEHNPTWPSAVSEQTLSPLGLCTAVFRLRAKTILLIKILMCLGDLDYPKNQGNSPVWKELSPKKGSRDQPRNRALMKALVRVNPKLVLYPWSMGWNYLKWLGLG